MINIVGLTEAVSGRYASYGNAYEFVGSMDEAASEFNYVLMLEAAEFRSLLVETDEIMVEAAIYGGAARVYALSESVFETVKNGFNKFWKKIKELVIGIINKLKEFFYTMTKNTSGWIKTMRSRVEAAATKSGASDLTFEMHKWDVAYVTSGMVDGVKSILGTIDDQRKGFNEFKTHYTGDAISTNILSAAPAAESDKSEGATKREEDYDRDIKSNKVAREKEKKEFGDKVATALGVSKAATLDAVWSSVAKKAKGGSAEKTSIKFLTTFGGAKSMLKVIEDSKNTITDLTNAYNDHLSDLKDLENDYNSYLEDTEAKVDKTLEDKMAGHNERNVERYKTKIKGEFAQMTERISRLEATCNVARANNTNYVKEMTGEFMHALNKLASFKEPKNS